MDFLKRSLITIPAAFVVLVPAAAAERTYGFIVSRYSAAMYPGPSDCPDGMTLDAIPAYLETLTPDERQRVTQPGKELALVQAASGDAQGHDACTYPTLFKRPPVKLVQGTIGYGMNLDGKISDGDFITPDGKRGIDNRFYRISGCSKRYRPTGAPGTSGDSYADEGTNASLRNGEMTLLLEISGADDLRRDGDVQVALYSGADGAQQDSQGMPIPYTTQRVSSNKKWWNFAHGKLVKGVITTDPIELRFKHKSAISYTEHVFRDARFQIEVLENGNLKATLAGYLDIETFYGGVPRAYARALETGGNFDCPSYYKALYDFADGPINPSTGRRDSISSAWFIEAVPAYIVRTDERSARSARK